MDTNIDLHRDTVMQSRTKRSYAGREGREINLQT